MRTAIVLSAITAAAAAGVGVAAWLTIETRQNRLVWDHFDVVKRGYLYRSGQLNPDQLDQALRMYGIRTLVNFQLPGALVDRERAIARKHGADFLNLPMPGDGFGQEAQFREVLKAVDDPARRPVMIHCGPRDLPDRLAVALFRFERDGWTIDDVSAEMQRQCYRDGWIPGYVYNMVKNRPTVERFGSQVRIDRNRPETDAPDAAGGKEPAHVH